jgi:hydrogenase/urease accessory protein HupE
MKRAWLLSVLVVGWMCPSPTPAHQFWPGYLQLRQTGAETYAAMWKVPATSGLRLKIEPRLPETCSAITPAAGMFVAGAYVERWNVRCAGGLTAGVIAVDGLASAATDALIRIERLDGTAQVAMLTADAPSVAVQVAPGRAQVAWTYLGLGVEHILLGIDHLLFVLALLFLVQGWRRVIITITAFTVAHSITLAAATLGLVHVPQAPVEASIALSIVFVATEIVRSRMGRVSVAERWPWVIAFVFGLLHGFGFAGALREVGMPEDAIPLALLCFNIGVEVGQLLFIAAVMGIVTLLRRSAITIPAWAWRVPVYTIGTLAMYWTIERVAGFWQA